MPILRLVFLLLGLAAPLGAADSAPAAGEPAAPAPAVPAAPAPANAAPAAAPSPTASTTQELWEKGNAAVTEKRWDEAREAYQAIVDKGDISAALFYNLGIAEMRRDRRGEAVVNFARAVALDPKNLEARQNLETAVRKAAVHTFSPSEDVVVKTLTGPRKAVWVNTAWISGWIALFCIVLLVWWTPRTVWPAVTLGILAIGTVIVSALGLYLKDSQAAPLSKRSVVIAEGVSAYAAPAENASSTVITLPPGSELVPVETRGHWRYCRIPVGKDRDPNFGWVRDSWITPLWPWDPALIE